MQLYIPSLEQAVPAGVVEFDPVVEAVEVGADALAVIEADAMAVEVAVEEATGVETKTPPVDVATAVLAAEVTATEVATVTAAEEDPVATAPLAF